MTSATDPKTIELYGLCTQHEASALGTITPGMLIERAAGGVQAHSTAQGGGNLHFATEYTPSGRTIDDDYASGDQVIFKTFQPGASVYALVPAAAAAITEGDFLVSNGDGTLRLQTATSTGVQIAQALEAVDNSAGGSPARIRVEVLPAFDVTLA